MASYVEEMFSLDGLVAVVTGGSSGIGRAIAGALAHAGGSVVVVARGEDRLASAVDVLTADGLPRGIRERRPGLEKRRARRGRRVRRGFRRAGHPRQLRGSEPAAADGRDRRADLGRHDGGESGGAVPARPAVWARHGRAGLRAADPCHLAAGPPRVRAERCVWRVQGRPRVAVPVPGGGVVAARGDQQHARPRLRHDPAEYPDLIRPRPGRGAGRPDDGGPQRVAEDFAGPAVFLASRASGYVTGQSIFVDGGLSVH